MENKKIKWFTQDRFGMFIHWGLYALPAVTEWIASYRNIPCEIYDNYAKVFNPGEFDPKKWAKLAKRAGMKYAVLTAKHHDGFAMFDTKLSDFKVTNTPYGKDVVKEFLDAFRAEDIKVGLYFSLLDWHHDDFPHFGNEHHPEKENEKYKDCVHDFDNYRKFMHGQIKELLTNYGKLDLMWFDFSYNEYNGEKWGAKEIVDMINEYQPQMIIDNRLEGSGTEGGSIYNETPGPFAGDYASPEQAIPPEPIVNKAGKLLPWEACLTFNRHWGFNANDHYNKSPKLIIRTLIECVSKGGNLLLNVGPTPDGEIPYQSVEILEEVAKWMDKNSESIYGCSIAQIDGKFLDKPQWGRYTMKSDGKTLYAHVFEEQVSAVRLGEVPKEKIKSIQILETGNSVKVTDIWTLANYQDIPHFFFEDGAVESYPLPNEYSTVAKIELK